MRGHPNANTKGIGVLKQHKDSKAPYECHMFVQNETKFQHLENYTMFVTEHITVRFYWQIF